MFGRFGWLVILIAGCEAGSVCGAPGEQCLAAREATRTHWGFVPDALQRADVDGDGVADLAGASHVRGTVSVVWGAGATPGEAATTWSVAPEVAGLAVVDVDLDGAMDLVTAAPGSDEVVVLRGLGRRGVTERRIAVGDEPGTVIAAQLAGGGAPELVTGRSGSRSRRGCTRCRSSARAWGGERGGEARAAAEDSRIGCGQYS